MTGQANETISLPVVGMTCGHCVDTVRRALESVPGVESARVELQPGLAEVNVDPDRVDRERLAKAITAAGYSVQETAPQLVTIGVPSPSPSNEGEDVAKAEREEWNLAIGGMHCASCVARVEGALRSVPGVKEARVNLATERAGVVVDPGRVREAELAKAVAQAGYSARR